VNSLVVLPDEIREGDRAVLVGSRARYAVDTHGVREGQSLKVAIMDGMRGEGRVLSVSPAEVLIALSLSEPRRDPIPISLIVGVSRPQTIKKVIQSAVMVGARSIHFVKSERGEKSYLQSHALEREKIEEETIKAMEQVWDSHRPEIVVHRALSYFMREKFPAIVEDARQAVNGGEVLKLVAHPGGSLLTCGDSQRFVNSSAVVAIGPERGWSDDEVHMLSEHDFQKIGLGERVLRVELALVFLLGQLAMLRGSGGRGL